MKQHNANELIFWAINSQMWDTICDFVLLMDFLLVERGEILSSHTFTVYLWTFMYKYVIQLVFLYYMYGLSWSEVKL